MNDKWQGQANSTSVGNPSKGFWYDPSVKESSADSKIAEALKYFIENPDELGVPTHISQAEKRVFFSNGKSHTFDEVVESYSLMTSDKDASFFDGPVDLGKEHDGDFPSVTWMPRGHEDGDVNDHALTAERGVPLSVFNVESAPALVERIKKEVKAPYVSAQASTLGGPEHVSILVTISTDARDTWENGILENSNYGKYHIDNDGTIEHFSGSLPKFRKRTAKTPDELLKILNLIPATAAPAPTVTSSEKTAEKQLDPTLLQKAVEQYVLTSPDIDWFDRYAEKYVDYVRSEAEEHGKNLSSNVIDRMLEELEETELVELFSDSEVESWLSALEGINTEEALDETYPKLLQSYYAVKPKPEVNIEFTSALDSPISEDQKTQIAAKWGPEYISALAHYYEAIKNKHPRDRAIQYAVSEMQKQNVTITPNTLSEVADAYAN